MVEFRHLEHQLYPDRLQRRDDHRGQYRDAGYSDGDRLDDNHQWATFLCPFRRQRIHDGRRLNVGERRRHARHGHAGQPDPAGNNRLPYIGPGQSAGQYGLVVNNGGNFLVYGSSKTPWAWGTSFRNFGATDVNITNADQLGWNVGDTITIGTETVTIVAPIFPGDINFTPALTMSYYPLFVVANLTHNVVVRSSGTDVGSTGDAGNTAYIANLVTNTTSFNLNYGDFRYLGNNSNGGNCAALDNHDCGISFVPYNTSGSISSSTIRNGWDGIMLDVAVNSTLNGNNIFLSANVGIGSNLASHNTLMSNNTYGGNAAGISLSDASNYNTLAFNNAYANLNGAVGTGISLNACNYNTLTSNTASNNRFEGIQFLGTCNNNILTSNVTFNNLDNGIYMTSSNNNTLTSNIAYGNTNAGIYVSGSNTNLLISNLSYGNVTGMDVRDGSTGNVLIADSMYSNSNGAGFGAGLGTSYGASGNVAVSCNIGYSSAAVSLPDAGNPTIGAEIVISNAAGNGTALVIKNSLVNPAPSPVYPSEFTAAGSYLLYYSTNPGVVQLYGNYQASGSTLTLDYANELYASTATTPADMSGHGSTGTVNSTYDSGAVSQLVTATYNGTTWDLVGSSTSLCSGLTAGSPQDCPSGAGKQFNITFLNGSSVCRRRRAELRPDRGLE